MKGSLEVRGKPRACFRKEISRKAGAETWRWSGHGQLVKVSVDGGGNRNPAVATGESE